MPDKAGVQAQAGECYIASDSVYPDVQKQEIGKKLLVETESSFSSARYMHFTVFEKNRNAI